MTSLFLARDRFATAFTYKSCSPKCPGSSEGAFHSILPVRSIGKAVPHSPFVRLFVPCCRDPLAARRADRDIPCAPSAPSVVGPSARTPQLYLWRLRHDLVLFASRRCTAASPAIYLTGYGMGLSLVARPPAHLMSAMQPPAASGGNCIQRDGRTSSPFRVCRAVEFLSAWPLHCSFAKHHNWRYRNMPTAQRYLA